jgi:tetratricopeptide (TPR) repeat protein
MRISEEAILNVGQTFLSAVTAPIWHVCRNLAGKNACSTRSVMEDSVVGRTWLNTLIAAVSAAGAAATTVHASPADLFSWKRSSAPTSAVTTPNTVPQTIVPSERPSASISPYKHPFKYLGASISEMPLPGRSKSAPVAGKTKKDSISLDTPTGPPTPQLKIAMAQMCEAKGDIAGARRQYQEALKQWPKNVDVLRAAARTEDRVGQLPLAERLYSQALAANPQHAGAHNDLGMCLARQGKLDASIREIEQAVRLEPANPRYRNNAAVVLVEMRQDQQALSHLAAVHAPADANYNMGQLLVQRHRAADAAPYFAAALEINPAMQPAYEALSKLQGQMAGQGPVVVPQGAPAMDVQQQAPATGPQLSYPSTARNPAASASSYVPPGYYAPAAQFPQQATPRLGQAQPRYLPAVPPQSQPQMDTMRR